MKAHQRRILVRSVLVFLAVACLAYLVARTYRGGNDINVYLHAAQQLLSGENIYAENPFNRYLYSPLFALMLSPLTLFPMDIARVLWMLINVALAVRLWWLLSRFVQDLPARRKTLWTILIILLSLGFINHNLMLGQVTILILWLTLEGIIQVTKGNAFRGALLLALGINFKIIPLLALVYLGIRGYFKSVAWIAVLVIVSLFLPAVVIGFQYNNELLSNWQTTINPAGDRYVFEDNDGCQSLNAVIPAFFYDFENAGRGIPTYERDVHFPRLITHVDHDVLLVIVQALRIALVLVLIIALWPGSWISGNIAGLFRRFGNRIGQEFSRTSVTVRPDTRKLFWHIGLLCLVSLLIFPHQMKYSMLYMVPAGGYILYYYFIRHDQSRALSGSEKFAGILAAFLLLVLTVMGRDIIGDHLVDILDYYHFMGISNILCIGILAYCHPGRL